MSSVSSDQTTSAPLPRTLFGYEVLDKLGEGGAGSIYAASDPSTGQLYAIKHVKLNTDKDRRMYDQLKNEFQIGKQVTHPSLRKSIEMKSNGGGMRKTTEAILVLELVHGMSMIDRLPPTFKEMLDALIKSAEAITALHELGYVHADLKPRNILVDDDGTVKLIDMGHSCTKGSVKPRMQGTEGYMAPEQKHCQPLNAQTDVFGFGATMYHLLTGQRLASGFSDKALDKSGPPTPPPAEIAQQLPSELMVLVMQCVREDIRARPASMDEVLEKLIQIRRKLAR